MIAHTPEPWTIKAGGIYPVCDGPAIAAMTTPSGYIVNHEANARRIVACVNACAGLPQDALDGGWTSAGISAYAKGLEQQRDDLLAALKSLSFAAQTTGGTAGRDDGLVSAIDQAAAAIAKAEGRS